MDDLEKAILILYHETGYIDPDLKRRAAAYCEEVKQVAGSWQLFVSRITESGNEQVQFWCLAALQEIVRARYGSMETPQRGVLKAALMSWLRGSVGGKQVAAFLRNKVAQLAVFIVQLEYPKEWPSFFHDLVGMLGEGPSAVDMFCRVLVAVDQDVVSLDIPRSHEEIQMSMALKDAMRDNCLEEISEAWIQLVASLHSQNPDLTAAVLDVVARYVNWVDISLFVANNRFVPLLYTLLQSGNEVLQAAAADVLTEIVSKRMSEAGAKLALIQQLGLVPMVAGWRGGLPGDEDGELALKCARLLAALCSEVLDSWKKVENAVVSIASVGFAVNDDAASEAQAAVTAAQGLLADMFPAVLATVRNGDEDVKLAVVPFLQSYVGKLKGSQKRLGALPEEQLQQVPGILEAIAGCAQYPEDSPEVEPESGPESTEWQETAAVVAERRQELFTLFRNTAKLSPERTFAFVGTLLQRVLQPGVPFQEVEMAVTLLYECGEGANEEMSKPGCGVLGQLAAGLMQVDVPSGKHRLVSLAVMETYTRYNKVVAQNPQLLNRILATFLGDHGMSHADGGVGARACYLFCRLVKSIRSSLRPALTDLLTALQPHLDRIATSPRPDPPSAMKSQAGMSSSTDDRLYAHEAAGLLVGGDDLPEAQQLACLDALMAPLLSQIDKNLPRVRGDGGDVAENGARGDRSQLESDAAAGLVLQALEGLNRLSKGLTLTLCTKQRPAVGERLAAPLQAAMRTVQAAPGHRALRGRGISFLHRMVECLGPHLLPYLPAALSTLMPTSTSVSDLGDVLTLLTQFITRYKAALQPLLASVLPEVVRRVHMQLPSDWDWTGRAALPPADAMAGGASGGEEARELLELQKAYFSLLHAVTFSGMAGILLQLQGASLDSALKALLTGASLHVEPSVRRLCFQVLKHIVTEVGSSGQAPESYQEFLQRLAGPVCIHSILTSGLDVRDAAVNALLGEAATLLLLLVSQVGQGLLTHLQTDVLPSLGLSSSQQETLLVAIRGGDSKALKAALSSLAQQASNAPRGCKTGARRQHASAQSANGNGMMM